MTTYLRASYFQSPRHTQWLPTLYAAGLLTFGVPSNASAYDFSGVPGTVIGYQEVAYGFMNLASTPTLFLSDPEILVLPNGDYLASHALAGVDADSADSGTTSVFRSTDKGVSWTKTGTYTGILRGSLFLHDGAVYLFGSSSDANNIRAVVMKSTNNATDWTVTTFTAAGGPATPNNPLVVSDRLWSAAGTSDYSASVNSNLLSEASWTMTGGFPGSTSQTNWLSQGQFIGEGQIVSSPALGLFIMPKVKQHALTALSRVNPVTGAVSFDPDYDFVSLPGGEKKFGAGYDAVSERFFVLSNPVPPAHTNSATNPDMIRNTAAVLSSRDLRNWKVEKLFLYSADIDRDGFGYMNFDFDGADMVAVSRTAFNVPGETRPKRGHDSNILNLHRLANFRTLSPDHYLSISGNSVLRFERTGYQDAPLGRFTLGTSFAGAALSSPDGLGQAAQGDVFIRESGGRILRFDATGNFLNTTNASPVALQGTTLSVMQPQDGSATWSGSGSGDWFYAINWHYWNRPDTAEDIAVFGSAAVGPATIRLSSSDKTWPFNTNGNFEGWTNIKNITNAVVANGVLSGIVTNSDPQIYRTDQAFPGSDFSQIRVRMKSALNNVGVDLYWGTVRSNSVAAVRLKTVMYSGNGAFQDLVFNMQGTPQWDAEVIRTLRLDPLKGSSAVGKTFEIDAITVCAKESYRIKGVRFINAQPYTLAGSGSLAIGATSGRGSLEVLQGAHAVQVPVVLTSDAFYQAAPGTALRFAGGLDVNGNTLTVSRDSLLVLTNQWRLANGTLAIEAGSAITIDAFSGGFDGTLRFDGTAGFSPAAGDAFHLLNGDPATNRFAQVILPELEEGLGWSVTSLYTAGDIAVIRKAPADWMTRYNLPSDGSADFLDSDTDGMDNYSEWKAGTDPTNSLSRFTLSYVPPSGTGSAFRLQWASLTNRTYRVEASSNLTAKPPFHLLQSGIPGEPDMTGYRDTRAVTPACFYRIIIE